MADTVAIERPKTRSAYLAELDPRDLLRHPSNPRKTYTDMDDLKASIAENDVWQPLIVIPDGDGFRIVMGHRRATAAAEVLDEGNWPAHLPETVQCIVRPDLVGLDAEQVEAMIVENDQRVNLTVVERAEGYAQLALFGRSVAEIAKKTGRDIAVVRTSLKLIKMGEKALKAADEGQLGLNEARRMEAFEADPDAMERLNRKIDNAWSLRHQLDEEEKRLKVREAEARLLRELADAGVDVIRRPKGWPYDCRAADVTSLRTADGEKIDVDAVKTKTGFAGFVDKDGSSASAVIVCLDPEAHGYKRRGYSRYKTPAEVAASQEAERLHQEKRRRRAELEGKLTDAQELRDQFLIETWGSAKAAKLLLVEAMRQAVVAPEALGEGDEELIRGLAGGDILGVRQAGVDRLNRVLVAMWLAAEADNLAKALADPNSNCDRRGALAFLDRLLENKYGLSEVETEARERLVQWIADDDAEKERRTAAAKAREEATAAEAGGDEPEDAGELDGRAGSDEPDEVEADEPEGDDMYGDGSGTVSGVGRAA